MANKKRRLVDLDRVIERLKKAESVMCRINGIKCVEIGGMLNFMATQPTVDAVEVVHGRWVFGTANHREYMKCSVCLKSQTPTGVFTYCPNCGAKMDGDGNDI